jgi:hypothetical protein
MAARVARIRTPEFGHKRCLVSVVGLVASASVPAWLRAVQYLDRPRLPSTQPTQLAKVISVVWERFVPFEFSTSRSRYL